MISILGIRHHGPGSARSVRAALDSLHPEIVLVEGPPDADDLIPLAGAKDIYPPVALLLYVPNAPQKAAFYPFAAFSPEWQAIQYALQANVPVRFMDLHQRYQLSGYQEEGNQEEGNQEEGNQEEGNQEEGNQVIREDESGKQKLIPNTQLPNTQLPNTQLPNTQLPNAQLPNAQLPNAQLPNTQLPNTQLPNTLLPDPFSLIAEAAGYSDGERWWEHFVEQRRSGAGDVFAGILELMAALRVETDKTNSPDLHNQVREASMRNIIRKAQDDGFQNIAIVCGAWHAPALTDLSTAKADEKLVKAHIRASGTVPIAVTWIPWTYDRLSRRNGYGAGIQSPGWYEHIWQTPENLIENWMVRMAQLMRDEDLDISPAHAIEATRLAEALATLRGYPLAGLPELDEAIQAIFCFGDDTPMRLIREKLIIGTRLGHVPDETPSVPLHRDIIAAQKRVRLEPSPAPETLDFDLRKPLVLERSQLLHRLNILNIPWGILQTTRGAKGTFREIWQTQWKPEFVIMIIEASVWGNTVHDAASAKVADEAAKATDLPTLTALVEGALLANLTDAIPSLLDRIERVAAASGDIQHLMGALPPLANVLRYGNVRQTDTSMIRQVVDELVTRICIGLGPACSALDDDAADAMFKQIDSTQNAIEILDDAAHAEAWARTLGLLAAQDGVHGLVRGNACRLLFDRLDNAENVSQQMSLALSPGTPAPQAAAWVQGFLHGSGQALIHHPHLWKMLDDWVLSLPESLFTSLLPLLRRTFSTFAAPERRQIGELAKTGGRSAISTGDDDLDEARAEKALALVIQILENEEKEIGN